jgi:hypothetical protein
VTTVLVESRRPVLGLYIFLCLLQEKWWKASPWRRYNKHLNPYSTCSKSRTSCFSYKKLFSSAHNNSVLVCQVIHYWIAGLDGASALIVSLLTPSAWDFYRLTSCWHILPLGEGWRHRLLPGNSGLVVTRWACATGTVSVCKHIFSSHT